MSEPDLRDLQRPPDPIVDQQSAEFQWRGPRLGGGGKLPRREFGRLVRAGLQAQHVPDEWLHEGGRAGEHERHGEPRR